VRQPLKNKKRSLLGSRVEKQASTFPSEVKRQTIASFSLYFPQEDYIRFFYE